MFCRDVVPPKTDIEEVRKVGSNREARVDVITAAKSSIFRTRLQSARLRIDSAMLSLLNSVGLGVLVVDFGGGAWQVNL